MPKAAASAAFNADRNDVGFSGALITYRAVPNRPKGEKLFPFWIFPRFFTPRCRLLAMLRLPAYGTSPHNVLPQIIYNTVTLVLPLGLPHPH